ncbi:hypothetical protein ACKWTF_010955 [Chironomus riparius]
MRFKLVRIFSANFEVLEVLMYACLIQLSRGNKIKDLLFGVEFCFRGKLINILHIRKHIFKKLGFLWIKHGRRCLSDLKGRSLEGFIIFCESRAFSIQISVSTRRFVPS